MKCAICKKTVELTFLKKPIGSYVKDKKGKKRIVCSECQKKYPTKAEIVAKL